MDIYMQAENDKAILKIYRDEDAISPRTDYDNLGTMVCWHRRYNLGDKHNYDTPRDFLEDLASRVCDSNQELLNEVIETKFNKDYRLAVDAVNKEWVIYRKNKRIDSYEAREDAEYALEEIKDKLSDCVFEQLSYGDLMDIIKKGVVMLPLFLYDHSGITISTGPFSDPWDSGQIGWIYALNDDIKKAFEVDKLTEETKQRAVQILEAEVKVYDAYLRGEVYGYILEEKITCEHCGQVRTREVDSCWGFYGTNFEDNGMAYYIPDEYQSLLHELQ